MHVTEQGATPVGLIGLVLILQYHHLLGAYITNLFQLWYPPCLYPQENAFTSELAYTISENVAILTLM